MDILKSLFAGLGGFAVCSTLAMAQCVVPNEPGVSFLPKTSAPKNLMPLPKPGEDLPDDCQFSQGAWQTFLFITQARGNKPEFLSYPTFEKVLAATARAFRLIDPSKIGTPDRQGKNTNLVIALSDPNGVGNNGQMPDGGPYLNITPDIQKIIDWIDGGCND